MKCVKRIQFPEVKRLKIEHPKNNNQDLVEFLEFAFPKKVQCFSFNFNNNKKLIDMSEFSTIFSNKFEQVTKEIVISHCNLTKEDLERIIKGSHNIK